MAGARIPGIAIGLVRDGAVSDPVTAGVRSATSGAPVDSRTIFEAASLSKPVFAYGVLQLIDAGVLTLDTPLSHYVPDRVPGDPRAAGITVRHVLSHTTGLPNWRGKDNPLKAHFPPGERFSYSGEGFVWLQQVAEAAAGEPLDALMRRLVFEPLEMRDSSYIWTTDFDTNHADPHDASASVRPKRKPTRANTAASLHTTAGDYARFLRAVLSGAGLSAATARLWREPQVRLLAPCCERLSPASRAVEQRVAWGFGWGLEPDEGTFFHWGDNPGFKAFVIGSRATQSAVVVFTNSDAGMSIMPELIRAWMPGEHPAFKWLGYARYVP